MRSQRLLPLRTKRRSHGAGGRLQTGDRILAELKDKMGGIAMSGGACCCMPLMRHRRREQTSTAAADAVSVLVNLGYGRSDAFGAVAQAVQRLGPDAGVEALIKDGLVELSAFEART